VHFGNVQQKSFHHIHIGNFLGELGEERHNSGRIITVEWGGMGSGISNARRWSIRFMYRNVDSWGKTSGKGMHRGMTGTLISWPAHSTSAGIKVGKMGRFAQWVAKMRLCAGNSMMRWQAGAGVMHKLG
jgi:hypothetical protein